MLVVEKEICFIDGLIKKHTKFHVISQIRVDFINYEIELQISHFINNEIDIKNSDYISSYLIQVDNLSDTDNLILQCWIAISADENSIFYQAKLEEH